MQFLPHVGLAIVTFVVTNIDDLLLLSIYFSTGKYRSWSIVSGQYLGIITLIVISLSGVLVGKILADHWVSLLGLMPHFLGIKDIFKKNDDDEAGLQPPAQKFHVLHVALVTVANGGDNVGVYAPVFGNIDPALVILYVVIFLLLTACWCWLGSFIATHPGVKRIFSKYGHMILPGFLIILGLIILKDFFNWAVAFL